MRAAGTAVAGILFTYAATCAALAAAPAARLGAAPEVRFERDIRPILSEKCFNCHGPDPGQRKGDLRLDRKEDALAVHGVGAAVVPGKPDASRLWLRVSAANPAHQMPPPSSGKTLTAREKDLLRRWIAQGAGWSQHWAFVPPRRPALPAVRNPKWARNPIDRFVLARLEKERLTPAPEADRVTLLRRLCLDLTGLPPTPEEVDAFVADRRPDAYERQVDRLLASPHYGERWGRHWLDAARYADSDGFEKDKPRFVSAYRDWVIHALNRDLPYNEFIIQQIAGDLEAAAQVKAGGAARAGAKSATLERQQKLVATGFLRNSMINEEGGVNPEQFRMEAMFDRMDAVGKGVLGLTIQCAQCHTHKFDPITHEEYYRMFAFLNNAHEANVAVYTPEGDARRAEIYRRTREIEAKLQHDHPSWPERMVAWEKQVQEAGGKWRVVRPELDGSGGQKLIPLEDGSILAQGYAPVKESSELTVTVDEKPVTAVRLELLNDPNLPRGGPGRSHFGLFGLTEFQAFAAPADGTASRKPVKIISATADVNPTEKPLAPAFDDKTSKKRVTGPIGYAIDGKDETAWSIDIGPGRSNVPRKAVFVFEKPVSFPKGTVLTFRLDQRHGGWNNNDNQNNNLGRYRLSVTDGPQPITADPLPPAVREALALPTERRSSAQLAEAFSFWRTTVPEWSAENAEIERLWEGHPEPSTQLVLAERERSRPTHMLERGNQFKPGKQVQPGVPAFLHPLPKGAPLNRLTFARWLVDPQSPTTSRSIVNRVWQSYFGTGIVRTSEDLGSQAEAPSHPELLDWLAVSFAGAEGEGNGETGKPGNGEMGKRGNGSSIPAGGHFPVSSPKEHFPISPYDCNWSLKKLHRLIVTSATYRQSSAAAPASYARDPENRLLARGPRFRVEGEIVRDIALAASGLLNPKIGGPSVYPPAPEFLFLPPASYGPKVWPVATGPDRYRRGLYTFRFRSVPYPALQNFDTPNGDASCVRRVRSNTPLQALTTLNEPIFMECAEALAAKTLREGGKTDAERLTYAFRRCVSRKPDAQELSVLLELLRKQSAPRVATTGSTVPGDLKAWTVVARVILNLDETITKE